MAGVTHLLRGADVHGMPIRYAIECADEEASGRSGDVAFEPGGPFESLLGSGWNGSAVELRIDCRIVIEPT